MGRQFSTVANPHGIDDTEALHSGPTIPGHKPPGHGIWCWDGNLTVWALIEDKSEPGFEVGPGPSGPGRYHGQTVRWASAPKKD